MSLLASLRVLLGVDSVEFKKGITEARGHVEIFENSFGQRSTLVERHGMRLANTAQGVALSMQRMKTDALGAIQDMAAAAGWGSLAIAVGGVAATYGILKTATDSVLKSVLAAGPPMLELVETLAGDPERFAAAADQLQMLIDRYQLAGPQWAFARDVTKENAQQILALTQAVQDEIRWRNQQAGVYDAMAIRMKIAAGAMAEEKRLRNESIEAMGRAKEAQERFNLAQASGIPVSVQMQIAMANGAKEAKAFADATRASLGVWNAADVAAKAADLQKQFAALASSGGATSQIVGSLAEKFASVVAVAAELGVELDPKFVAIAEAIKKGPGWEMDSLVTQFRNMPKEAGEGAEQSNTALLKIGDGLKSVVSGGLGRGVEEGISTGEQALNAWQAAIAARGGIIIPIKLDLSQAQRDLDNLNSGRIPQTGG